MATPPTERFALLRLDRREHDAMRLAKALAQVRGTPVQDQVIEARRAWGIVADDLPEDEARALGEALKRAGVTCAVGPHAALVDLPPAEAVRTLESSPSHAPALIAAAGIEITSTSTKTEERGPSGAQKAASAAIMMTTGIPIRVGGGKRTVETTRTERDLVFLVDLHYGDAETRHRIEAAHFDFSCLGERMVYQALGNFRLLVRDLVERAPGAWLNHGTRVLVEGRPMRTMDYRSVEDVEREARWLLTLARFGM